MVVNLIIQTIIAILITVLVLLQGQSSGLGSAFGGSSNYHTKRGMEKSIYIATIFLLILFVGSTLTLLII
jgi:preprotein translocase subunit SecG